MQPEPGAATSVTAGNVDLSNCDKEIIHMPGMIQPHGAMLVLRLPDLAILQASENTAALFGVPAPDLTLKGLADMLGPDHAATLQQAISGRMDCLDRFWFACCACHVAREESFSTFLPIAQARC